MAYSYQHTAPREARYGAHTYEVRVSTMVATEGVLYVDADGVNTTDGTLILLAEETPLEAQTDSHLAGIELTPILVVAPGQWYAVRMVNSDHQPLFDANDISPPPLATTDSGGVCTRIPSHSACGPRSVRLH